MKKKYSNPCVYTLKDPITSQVHYVGSTVTRLSGKLATHVFDSNNRCSHPTAEWIKGLTVLGQKPVIEVLEYCQLNERGMVLLTPKNQLTVNR